MYAFGTVCLMCARAQRVYFIPSHHQVLPRAAALCGPIEIMQLAKNYEINFPFHAMTIFYLFTN
jgi:hypothetical protein